MPRRSKSGIRGTIAAIGRLIALQDNYRRRAGEAMRPARAITPVDQLFRRPTVTVNEAVEVLGVSYRAVRRTIDRLVGMGTVEEFADTCPKLFIARGIPDAVFPPD